MDELLIAQRPIYQFTPHSGWINDPNGLIFYQGHYHLFAQHNPYDARWGPMHWLHAFSPDLVAWQELPIALAPDDDGMIFSGSAWYDEDNRTGLGTDGQPPLLLFYTLTGNKPQNQCLAWSTDGQHFTRYAGNPVVANPGLVDFRDPKVFRNPDDNLFHMVIAAGDHVEFYASTNLLDWQKSGTFGPEGNHCPGVWECPDLLPFESDDGTRLWVLLVSHIRPAELGGPRTQYFLGDFDGQTFVCRYPEPEPIWFDPGFDNYAAVSFASRSEAIVLGWGSNWCYASQVPTDGYRGQMTYPRRLSLRQTHSGWRLAAEPWPAWPAGEVIEPAPDSSESAKPAKRSLMQWPIQSPCRLSITASGPFTLTLQNEDQEIFRLGLDDANQIWLDRTAATRLPFWPPDQASAFTLLKVPRLQDGACHLNVLLDRTAIELFADDGLVACHQLLFPRQPYTNCRCTGQAAVEVCFLSPTTPVSSSRDDHTENM